MNHDITHCEGDNCELRELCKRYIAHKKRHEAGGIPLPYMTPDQVGKDCDYFFRHHEENN